MKAALRSQHIFRPAAAQLPPSFPPAVPPCPAGTTPARRPSQTAASPQGNQPGSAPGAHSTRGEQRARGRRGGGRGEESQPPQRVRGTSTLPAGAPLPVPGTHLCGGDWVEEEGGGLAEHDMAVAGVRQRAVLRGRLREGGREAAGMDEGAAPHNESFGVTQPACPICPAPPAAAPRPHLEQQADEEGGVVDVRDGHLLAEGAVHAVAHNLRGGRGGAGGEGGDGGGSGSAHENALAWRDLPSPCIPAARLALTSTPTGLQSRRQRHPRTLPTHRQVRGRDAVLPVGALVAHPSHHLALLPLLALVCAGGGGGGGGGGGMGEVAWVSEPRDVGRGLCQRWADGAGRDRQAHSSARSPNP